MKRIVGLFVFILLFSLAHGAARTGSDAVAQGKFQVRLPLLAAEGAANTPAQNGNAGQPVPLLPNAKGLAASGQGTSSARGFSDFVDTAKLRSISVKVVDASTGAPVPNVLVTASQWGDSVAVLVTDPNGVFDPALRTAAAGTRDDLAAGTTASSAGAEEEQQSAGWVVTQLLIALKQLGSDVAHAGDNIRLPNLSDLLQFTDGSTKYCKDNRVLDSELGIVFPKASKILLQVGDKVQFFDLGKDAAKRLAQLGAISNTDGGVEINAYHMVWSDIPGSGAIPPLASIRDADCSNIFPARNAPDTPSAAMAQALSDSSIRVSWQRPTADNQTGFEIAVTQGGNGNKTADALATNVTFESLNKGTYYCFTVRAYNSRGYSQWSVPACAKTTGSSIPDAPANVHYNFANGQYMLEWSHSGSDVLYFNIYWKRIPGSPPCSQQVVASVVATVAAGARSYQYTPANAPCGQALGVSAVGDGGESAVTWGGFGL